VRGGGGNGGEEGAAARRCPPPAPNGVRACWVRRALDPSQLVSKFRLFIGGGFFVLFVFLEFALLSARVSVGQNRILIKGFRSMTKDFHDVLLKITFFHGWVLRVSAFLISSPVIFLRFLTAS